MKENAWKGRRNQDENNRLRKVSQKMKEDHRKKEEIQGEEELWEGKEKWKGLVVGQPK